MSGEDLKPATDSAGSRPLRYAGLAALVLLLNFALVQVPTFHELRSPDAMRYADAARSFLRGDGFVTQVIQPRHLKDLRFTERVRAPQILERFDHYYVYPLVLAGVFSVTGPSDRAVFATSAFFWFLTGLLVFALARRIAGDRAALAAVVIFALQAKTTAFSVTGVSEPLCMAFMIGAILLTTQSGRTATVAGSAAIAGGFWVLGNDVRQPMLFVMPIVVAGGLSLATDRRRMRAAAIVAGYGLVALALGALQPVFFPPRPPLPAGQTATATNHAPTAAKPSLAMRWLGANALIFTGRYPGHALERTIDDIDPSDSSLGAAFGEKMGWNARLIFKALAFKTGSYLFSAAFLLAAWRQRRSRETARLSLIVLALLGATAAVCLLVLSMDRYFQLFGPLMAVVIAAGSLTVLQSPTTETKARPRRATAFVAASVALLALSWPLPFGHQLGAWAADIEFADLGVDARPKKAAVTRLLASRTRPGEMIFSDAPFVSAWYADRPSIWLPLGPQDVLTLNRSVAADALLVTLEDPQGYEVWRDWLKIWATGAKPAGWEDWSPVGAESVDGRGVYLFRRADAAPSGESGSE